MRSAAAAIVLFVAALPAGCGGGETTATSGAETAARPPAESRAYVPAANRVCRQMLEESRRLGREFIAEVARSDSHDLLAAETDGLIRPGVRILDSAARRLRAVEVKYPDSSLEAYVGLYEPLLQLAHLRLQAGEVEDLGESKNLEHQMEQIGAEQRVAAKLAGLDDCRIDFLHALVSSWNSP